MTMTGSLGPEGMPLDVPATSTEFRRLLEMVVCESDAAFLEERIYTEAVGARIETELLATGGEGDHEHEASCVTGVLQEHLDTMAAVEDLENKIDPETAQHEAPHACQTKPPASFIVYDCF